MRSQMALMAIAINLAAGFSVQDNCGPEANIEKLSECLSAARAEAYICDYYTEECPCDGLGDLEDCYYEYCTNLPHGTSSVPLPGTTCLANLEISRSSKAPSGQATQADSEGVAPSTTENNGGSTQSTLIPASTNNGNGGSTQSTITPAPISTSNGETNQISSSSNSKQPSPSTSTGNADMLFAPAGAFLASFIGVLAWL